MNGTQLKALADLLLALNDACANLEDACMYIDDISVYADSDYVGGIYLDNVYIYNPQAGLE